MKQEIFPALDWMLENEIPEAKSQDRRKFREGFLPYNWTYATSLTTTNAYGNISILQDKSSQFTSQSKSLAELSVEQDLSSKFTSQSSSNCIFYFPTFILLTSGTLCQSFGYGTETDVTLVQQLQSDVIISQSISKSMPIYYVNYGSAFVSQSYMVEISKAHIIDIRSKSISASFLVAQVSDPYLKKLLLTSKCITQSESLADLIASFKFQSTTLSQTISKSNEIVVARPLSAEVIADSHDFVSATIKQNLQSQYISSTFSKSPKNIKLGLHSRGYLQSLLQGQEVLTRLLAATSDSQSSPNTQITRSIKINSNMISQSDSYVGEIITRKLNGVAESISIAQKSLGSVSRLFVSSSISPTFSRATGGYLNRHLYSSFYSQCLVQGNEVVVRPLAAKSNSQNPFHGNIDRAIPINSKAASATISNTQKTMVKPLSATSNSQNPFHSNPNIFQELQSKAKTEAFAKANGINKKVNVYSKAPTQSELTGQEVISRPLSASSLVQDYSITGLFISKQLNGSGIVQTESNTQEVVTRPLASEIITQSIISKSSVNISRPVSSEITVDTYSIAQNLKKKINLGAKGVLQTESSVDEIISRQYSSKNLSQTIANADGFNTLVNLYGSSISDSFARSELLQKEISLYSQVIIQSYIGGTDTYFGNKQAEITFVEPDIEQNVINLAPFNYPDQKEL